MTDTPHFDLPFRYVNGAPVVNQQDSLADIATCVYAVLVTNPGAREEMPNFGFNVHTFDQQPLSSSVMAQEIRDWEPRAAYLLDVSPNTFDQTRVDVDVNVEVST